MCARPADCLSAIDYVIYAQALCLLLAFIASGVQAREYRVSGPITDQTYIDFKRALADTSRPPIRRVLLNSTGGAFFPAIAMGQLIHAEQLDVEVSRLCASACANYLFLAGHRKYLNRRSLLIFHGGIQQDNLFAQLDQMVRFNHNPTGRREFEGFVFRKPIHPQVARDIGVEDLFKIREPRQVHRDLLGVEARHFQRLKIDPLITVYGQRGNYYATYASGRYKGFYYDIESMQAFGVRNINVLGPKWRPWKGDRHREFYAVKVRTF